MTVTQKSISTQRRRDAEGNQTLGHVLGLSLRLCASALNRFFQSGRAKAPRLIAFAALTLTAAVLGGCATGGKSRPEGVAGGGPKAQGHSVARLKDGREGFIIRETHAMNAQSRQDFARAVALMQSQQYGQAIELLRKVIEHSPAVTAPYINIAIAYRQTGETETAERHLQTALKLVPGHPVASNEYGLLLRQTGRFAEARTVYEKTLAAFPDYHPARRNLGILCDLYLHDLECALQQYEIYSRAMPDDEQVKIWIADLRQRLGL